MADYEFELPFPPSINGYWRSFRGRQIISARGRNYRVFVLDRMMDLGLICEDISKDIEVSITLNPPTLRSYDVDNFCKAIFDALTHAKFWIDDSQVQKLTIKKGEKIQNGNVLIVVNVI